MFNRKIFVSAGLFALVTAALIIGLLFSGGSSAAQPATQAEPTNIGQGSENGKSGALTNRYYDANAASAALKQANTNLQTARSAISNAANSGVDTGIAAGLVAKASALYNQAGGFNSKADYYKAGSYADASSLASNAAAALIAAALNQDPPASMPIGGKDGKKNPNLNDPAAMQRLAVSELTQDYYQTVNLGNEVRAQSNAADYIYYITTAQSVYGQAYNAYQAGNYKQAIVFGSASAASARVADVLIRSKQTPPAPTTPQPPAPKFGK